jgi:glycine cleavage system transcriptional repressor
MNAGLTAMGLHVHVKEFDVTPGDCAAPGGEPFIITVRGPDRKGLVADITEVIAKHQVNIVNLQAIFKGGSDPGDNVMIYEVVFHDGLDQKALRREIRRRSDELGLEISVQHRNIFEAINRI